MKDSNFDNARLEEKLRVRLHQELNFNSIRYKQVSLGSIFANFYKASASLTLPTFSFKGTLKLVVSVFSKLNFFSAPLKKNATVFVHYSNHPKDWSILDGVESKWNRPENLYRFISNKLVQQYTPIDFVKWLWFWFFNFWKINQRIKFFFKSNNLPFSNGSLVYIVLHSLYIEGLLRRFRKYKPKILLLTYDRDQYSSIVTTTANALNIETATILHGSSFHLPMGYVPFIAKDVLVWGEEHLTVFKRFNVALERMRVVGFPNFKSENLSLRKRVNVDNARHDQYIVLLASQPNQQENAVINRFLDDLACRQDIYPMIKLHPSASSISIPAIKSKYPHAHILDKNTSAEEAVLMADVIVGLSSTLLLEALSFHKPCVVYNPVNEDEEGIGGLLVEKGKALRIKGSNEFLSILPKKTNNLNEELNLQDQLEYFRKIATYRGEESEFHILEYLNSKY